MDTHDTYCPACHNVSADTTIGCLECGMPLDALVHLVCCNPDGADRLLAAVMEAD